MQFENFPNIDTLHFHNLFNYVKGEIRNLIVSDSTLICINSTKSNYFCYNYSFINSNLSPGYLRKGKGPNEGIGIFTSGVHDNLLWFHDITKQRYFYTSLKNALSDTFPKKFKSHKLNSYYFHIGIIDSLKYLGVGDITSSKKLSLSNIKDTIKIEEFGEFELIPKTIPLAAYIDSYASNILVKADSKKAIIFYRYTDIIELFDLKTKKITTIQGPDNFNVTYEVGVNSNQGAHFMKKTEKTRKAYVNGTVSNNFIYLLYSGCSYNDSNWSNGLSIHVFNWDGSPVIKYILDRPVYAIGISSNEKKLYSYDKENGNIIYTNLKDLNE